LQQSRGRRRAAGPHPIDVHVGSRVRLRRNMLEMSQTRLADALGLTFQQVQKYERGADRIGASRLLEMALLLDVPIGFFYDYTDPVRAPAMPGFAQQGQEAGETDLLQAEETVELVMAYYNIRSPKTRDGLFKLARVLAEPDESPRRRGRRGPGRAKTGAGESVSLEGQGDSLSGADT
jgi:transcriptional regulator with XRE-family HTH domain